MSVFSFTKQDGGDNTIVEALRPLVPNPGHDLRDLRVDRHTLNVDVCKPEHSQCRGVVRSTALEANKARLDNVYPSNAVAASDIVQGFEELERARHGLTAFNLEFDRHSRSEGNGELGGNIGGVERV